MAWHKTKNDALNAKSEARMGRRRRARASKTVRRMIYNVANAVRSGGVSVVVARKDHSAVSH